MDRMFTTFHEKVETTNFFLLLSLSVVSVCGRMDYSLPGSSVCGIFQAKILEWAAISYSRGSSRPRD